MKSNRGKTSGRQAALALLTLGTAWAAGGCGTLDRLLEVELPGQIEASDAETPAKAEALVSGGVTMFNCALTWHIVRGGLLGDELASGPGLTMADNRANFIDYTSPTSEGPNCASHYGAVAEARWQNDHTLGLLEGWTDAEVANRTALIARVAAYAGYSYLLLGEGFCTAAIDGGPEIQPPEVLARAETRFTRAMEAGTAAGNADLVNLARVGRARTRLDLGRKADARADAVLVPEGFVWLARFPGTATRVNENNVFNFMGIWTYTVDGMYRDLRYAGVPDPRVPVVNAGRLNNYGLPLWSTTKYASLTTSVELATGKEAQLIVAEAAVAAGDLVGAVAIINKLHMAAGLPPFNSTNPAEVSDQIVYERRAELFLEGQHVADFRRYPLPLVPAVGTSYYGVAGTFWGSERCYPISNSERSNNPNFAFERPRH